MESTVDNGGVSNAKAFANGEINEVGVERWLGFDDEPREFKDVVVKKLGALVRRSGETIARKSPRSVRNRDPRRAHPA